MGELEWLMGWYASQCNGDWEHHYGVEIGTLDNPGWTVTIDLEDTDFEGREFSAIQHGLIETDASWWRCRTEGKQWRAECGSGDLGVVLGLFRSWINSN
jgi:hypothetical protein